MAPVVGVLANIPVDVAAVDAGGPHAVVLHPVTLTTLGHPRNHLVENRLRSFPTDKTP
jgi:hypothetical protein